GSGTYDRGAQVSVSANEASGQSFVRWTGDTLGLAAPGAAQTMLNVLGPATIVAQSQTRLVCASGKPTPGACGCGMPDVDADGDGVPDCIDLAVQSDTTRLIRVRSCATGVANRALWGGRTCQDRIAAADVASKNDCE